MGRKHECQLTEKTLGCDTLLCIEDHVNQHVSVCLCCAYHLPQVRTQAVETNALLHTATSYINCNMLRFSDLHQEWMEGQKQRGNRGSLLGREGSMERINSKYTFIHHLWKS